MNAIEKLIDQADDDTRFDRLVDGELSPDEYKSLVGGLDDEPGGWRRCALAFLEAQALGGELSAIRARGQLHESAALPVTPQSLVPASSATWKLLLGMSASFLVAFILGVTLPGLLPIGAGRGGPTGGSGNLAVNPTDRQPGITTPADSMQAIGNVQLDFDGPGGPQLPTGAVPLYEVPAGMRDEWLAGLEPVLPADLVNELKRRGHRVERVEQLVPISLEDGREGVVPVERYQITPVSRRAY